MNTIEIEVMSQHYVGPLLVEPVKEDYSQFSVYLNNEFLGRAQPVRKLNEVLWYSHEITDKEMLRQIGEWIAFYYPLTPQSFKPIYDFNWAILLPAASVLLLLLLS